MRNASTGILLVIILSQFACTSLWFAGNAVMPSLIEEFQLSERALGDLTSAVQFGFIIGTLTFALLTLADRFSPSRVFFFSALAAALFNLLVAFVGPDAAWTLVPSRFGVGFFLAGIYPVGMKIAADHFDKGLGKALGFLVGALVLGTAFPHLLRFSGGELDWQLILFATSGMAILGGLLIFLLVPDGPHRKPSQKFDARALFKVFRNKAFRGAAFGYFGHMWELYAFWAFVPVMLELHRQSQQTDLSVSIWSFAVIGVGMLGCWGSGLVSLRWGAGRTAFLSLLCSGICCLASPLFLSASSFPFLPFLLFWGVVVVADSPLFSTLVAQNAPAENRGTALTIVNSIGFAVTILTIQLTSVLQSQIDPRYVYVFLAIGPAMGLAALVRGVSLRRKAS